MRFKIFIIISIIFSLFLFYPTRAADYGLKATQQATQGDLPTSIKGATTIAELAGIIINIALSLIGIFFFILMLYAGITWMKAMGNTEDVTKAKEMITQAIIGLVIIMAAYAITNFVFTNLGGGGSSPSSPNGGAITHTDGQSCSVGAIKTGKWNCGSGTKPGVKCDGGECQTPCRYSHADGECKDKNQCTAAGFKTETNKCPDDKSKDVLCCFSK